MQKIELQHKINVACMLCKDLDQPGIPQAYQSWLLSWRYPRPLATPKLTAKTDQTRHTCHYIDLLCEVWHIM